MVSAPLNQSEANATYHQLTPDVPMDNSPSADTIGRYYDAFPLNAKDKPDLLVSWADGPVESGVLAAAGLSANFGVYLYDSAHQQRHPILDDPEMWDIFARPLQTRTAPNIVGSAQDPKLAGQTLIGSLNVYTSTLHTFNPGEIFGVRVMEGFSSEEGFPEMFGTTEFEGHADLGVARVQADGSWSAKIPANVPVHLQAVDIFGMSLFNEPVWFSGRPGEARVCGGCHESRTSTTNVTPGILDTFAAGAAELFGTTPRAQRLQTAPASATDIVGVSWGVLPGGKGAALVQPIFDAHCISCHNGVPGAANPSYTITDPTGAMPPVTWTFDLTGGALPASMSVVAGGGSFSKSYFTMAGPNMEAIQRNNLMITGDFKVYMNPEDAHGSIVIQKLNPTQLFPVPSKATRAFATAAHLVEQGQPDLSAQEFYTLILAADMGVTFYARENNPGLSIY